jgi:hypothetical protein
MTRLCHGYEINCPPPKKNCVMTQIYCAVWYQYVSPITCELIKLSRLQCVYLKHHFSSYPPLFNLHHPGQKAVFMLHPEPKPLFVMFEANI